MVDMPLLIFFRCKAIDEISIKNYCYETVSHKTPQSSHNPSHQVVSTNQPYDIKVAWCSVW